MAHFAKIQKGIVTEVIVADPDFFDTFVDDSAGEWIQTSYNTRGGQHPEGRPLRKNYAGIGFTYDSELDAFIPPQPYPSWTINTDTGLWNAPTPRPNDDGEYQWNEDTLSWVEIVTE
jgi:hypothetical protein